MTNNQLFIALAGLLIAFFGFVFKYVDHRFDALSKELTLQFERIELLLKMHEAVHHNVKP